MIEIVREYNYWDDQPIVRGFFRETYVNTCAASLGTSLVKVILGQRRVGKSYLLRMVIERLIKENGVNPSNILYINKDIHELEFINDNVQLQRVIDAYKKELKPKGTIYIFLDEVQEIESWEKVVNSLSQDYKQKYEVFITGSNAKLLSTELATYLGGRYLVHEVFPFSYREFLGIKRLERGKASFLEYLKSGGIPESYHLPDQEMKRNYYSTLLDSIVLRDIVHRHNVRDSYLLGRLIKFLIDSVGSYFSVHSVVKYLDHSGYKTNSETVGSYLEYLKSAYFIHESERYDIKGKKILGGEKKFYLNDLGFKYFSSSSFNFAVERFLENIVFIDLLRSGYDVRTGRMKGKEIDFIAERSGALQYIQVSYLLSEEATIEREFGNLELIDDNFEKIVVSMDDVNLGNRRGVKHINAWDFLF